MCQNIFFNKVAGLRLWHRCFLVNFAEFLRTLFLQNTSSDCFCKLITNFGPHDLMHGKSKAVVIAFFGFFFYSVLSYPFLFSIFLLFFHSFLNSKVTVFVLFRYGKLLLESLITTKTQKKPCQIKQGNYNR